MTSVVLSKSSCWTKYIIFPGKVSEKTESNYSSASVGSENSRTLRSNSNLGLGCDYSLAPIQRVCRAGKGEIIYVHKESYLPQPVPEDIGAAFALSRA